jgi:hypothetical protein
MKAQLGIASIARWNDDLPESRAFSPCRALARWISWRSCLAWRRTAARVGFVIEAERDLVANPSIEMARKGHEQLVCVMKPSVTR